MNGNLKNCLDIPYSTIVVPDVTTDNEPCFMAYHPELKGCMSHGSTQNEALQNLSEVTELYISTLLEKGLEVPPPGGMGINWDIMNPITEPQADMQMVPSIAQPVFLPV